MKALLPVFIGTISGILFGLAFAAIQVKDPAPLLGWIVGIGPVNLVSLTFWAANKSGSRRGSLTLLSLLAVIFLVALFGSHQILRA